MGLCLSACACYGQSLLLGVTGGARLTGDIAGNATTESKKCLLGPRVELQLPFGLGVEFDALYSREGYSTPYQSESERANSWEFPILLKYRLAVPVVKPYVEAGYAPRVINGSINGITPGECAPLCIAPYPFHTTTDWSASQGLVLGGGVEIGVRSLRVSPELRFTRWNNAAIDVAAGGFHSTQDQVDLLVGIAWKAH